MAVSTTDYGSFKVHVGTLAEVAGAIKGEPANKIKAFYYDSGQAKTVAVVES
ncbi:MAG: hypothetical protein ACTSXO_06950 [Candidatus Heimdallarchaeota archaeon]